MKLFVLGLNHKTAPIELREKFSIAPEREGEFIRLWEERADIPEKTVISTCNRTELYGVAADADAARAGALEALSSFTGVAQPDFESNVYFKTGPDSVAHLFSVASGLDSLAVGETEILGQVKNAYLRAQASRLTGGILNPLFQKSLAVGKKVRSQTDIGAGKISVASISIDLATKIFDDLSQKRLLLVGSGDVARQVCEAIVSKGSRHFWIANRSPEKAKELARVFGAEDIPYGDIDAKLSETDIVIASASTPEPIISAARVTGWMRAKKGRSLFLIDLGVPRNIEPAAGDVTDVYLYNLDDLKSIAIRNVAAREHAAASCREIISAATEAFMRRLSSRPSVKTA